MSKRVGGLLLAFGVLSLAVVYAYRTYVLRNLVPQLRGRSSHGSTRES
jgi:hypothetical protein